MRYKIIAHVKLIVTVQKLIAHNSVHFKDSFTHLKDAKFKGKFAQFRNYFDSNRAHFKG